jgi:hypothetical protein
VLPGDDRRRVVVAGEAAQGGREGQVEVEAAGVVGDEDVEARDGAAKDDLELVDEPVERRGDLARVERGAGGSNRRVAGVGERDPEKLDPRVARPAPAGDDADRVPGVGEEPGVPAEDGLDAADDRGCRVVEKADAERHRSDDLAEAVREQVLEVTAEDGE